MEELEPAAKQMFDGQDKSLRSIAISLKRIADHIDEMKRTLIEEQE